jgi:hypothetical protein
LTVCNNGISRRVCRELHQRISRHYSIWQNITIQSGKIINEASGEEEQDAWIDAWISKLLKHYLPETVALGMPRRPDFLEQAALQQKMLTKRYIKFDIGFAVQNKSSEISSEIKVLLDNGGHGLCLIEVFWTFKSLAKSGLESWDTHLIYGYRKKPTGEEGIEVVCAEDEATCHLKHVGPTFLEGL